MPQDPQNDAAFTKAKRELDAAAGRKPVAGPNQEEVDEKEARDEFLRTQSKGGGIGGAAKANWSNYPTWRKTYTPKSKRKMNPLPSPSPSPTPKLTDLKP